MSRMETSTLTKERIITYLEKSKRFDSRGLDEYRDVKISFDVSKNAEGAASVKIGKTHVMVGVKMDVGEPYRDSEDKGVLITSAEILGMAGKEYEPGPPKFAAIELARIIDRGIRESGMIDFKKLCIKEGEKVWIVFLDIYVLNDDGNLMDAAALGAVAAILKAKMPEYNEKMEWVEFGKFTDKGLPLTKDIPITFTAYKINNSIILDPCKIEEETSDGRVSIAISIANNKEPKINACQKGEEGDFSEEELEKIIDMVIKKSKTFYPELMKKIQEGK